MHNKHKKIIYNIIKLKNKRLVVAKVSVRHDTWLVHPEKCINRGEIKKRANGRDNAIVPSLRILPPPPSISY